MANYQKNSFLDWQTPIVDPKTGLPTPQFIRLWQSLLQNEDTTIENIDDVIAALALKANKSTQIIAGTGLSGGGDLSADRTIDLDASLDDLNDVDLTTTPPADGNALVFDALSSLWVPGAGGGGGGGMPWETLLNQTIAAPTANLDVNVTAYDDVIVFVDRVTCSTGTRRAIRFSTDGGATYHAGATDYQFVSNAGVAAGAAVIVLHATANSAARSGWAAWSGGPLNGILKPVRTQDVATLAYLSVNSLPITNVRIFPEAGNFTGGVVYVFGRKKPTAAIGVWNEVASWDFSIDGAVASVPSSDLTGYSEVLIQGRGVGASVSGQRVVQVSVNNGVSWYTTSGDYNELAATGVATNNQAMFPHTTATGSARDFAVQFPNIQAPFKVAHLMPRMVEAQFVASTTQITNVRVINSTGGNLNAGQVKIYAR